MKKANLLVVILYLASYTLHAEAAITESVSKYIYFDEDEQNLVIFSNQNRTLFLLLPVLLKGKLGNTSFYFSPGLGYDSLDGLNLGCDFGVGQQIGNWNFSAGFGMGLNLLAVGGYASYNGIGVGYYTAFFGNADGPGGQSNEQIVGGIQFFTKKFSLRFENDFLFEGDKYDRWRTAAIEIGIKNFIVGTYIYSNEPNKEYENYTSSTWKINRKAYSDGEIYRSIFYVGYRYSNRIIRIGINHPVIQDIFQNGWHTLVNKPYFHTPYGRYSSIYFYIGYYNPFSLYGK
jgi:hypothetical protein